MDKFVGTLCYLAPEIVKNMNYDSKVDVWSIGLIAYMLLTGQMLISGDIDDEVVKMWILNLDLDDKLLDTNMSDQAKDFLIQCLNKNPRTRWSCE